MHPVVAPIPQPKPLPKRRTDRKEADIEQDVWRYAKELGFYQRKYNSMAHSSVPDRVFISPFGLHLYIEFKRFGRTPTDNQEKELGDLNQHYQLTRVIDTVDEGKWVLNRVRNFEPTAYFSNPRYCQGLVSHETYVESRGLRNRGLL